MAEASNDDVVKEINTVVQESVEAAVEELADEKAEDEEDS